MVKSFVARYDAYNNYYKPLERGLHADCEYAALVDIKQFVKQYRALTKVEDKLKLIDELVKGSLEDKIERLK